MIRISLNIIQNRKILESFEYLEALEPLKNLWFEMCLNIWTFKVFRNKTILSVCEMDNELK